ncbi:hypothetical protein GJ496_009076 [Pomphorhynchus laevis]|nr:hypothetical protein GJ496_009076 [Pomphorhynchus laevis]
MKCKLNLIYFVRQIGYYFPANKLAICESNGTCWTFSQLLQSAKYIASTQLQPIKENMLIGLCFKNNSLFTISMFACWIKKCVAVPISTRFPLSYQRNLVSQVSCSTILCDHDFSFDSPGIATKQMSIKNMPHLKLEDSDELSFDDHGYACILFTSGSSGRPKPVVLTHNNLKHQIRSMETMWKWSSKDHLIHALPLNHIHGLVNGLLTSLYSRATCTFVSPTNSDRIWNLLQSNKCTIFMGVPPLYRYLLLNKPAAVSTLQLETIRIIICGSAPLPNSIFNDWKSFTDKCIIERYGMTETGMILGQQIYPGVIECGNVGLPFPFVSVRLVDDNGNIIYEHNNLSSLDHDSLKLVGEIQVKGPTVFSEYLGMPDETRMAFTADGWFKTGDISQYYRSGDQSYFKLLGRNEIDTVKVGGEKISLLEIERVILNHPKIVDCVVLADHHCHFGNSIYAIITCNDRESMTLNELRRFCSLHLPQSHVPLKYKLMEKLPRNEMGKIDKKSLQRRLFS